MTNWLKRLFKNKEGYAVEEYIDISKSSTLQIPNECYTIVAGERDSHTYTIYEGGEYINDVYAIVRYGNWPKKANINWREEIEGVKNG